MNGVKFVAFSWLKWSVEEFQIISPVHVSGVLAWGVVAEAHLDVEVHIGPFWDPFSADWGLHGSTTVDQLGWALNVEFGSWLDLGQSEVEALEGLGGSNGEDLVSSLSIGVVNLITVLEVSLVRNFGPLSIHAFLVLITVTVSFGSNINFDFGHVIFWTGVGVVSTVWSENIWSSN